MKSLRLLISTLVMACVWSAAGADDGAITNKSMSGPINVPEGLPNIPPVAEHAFTGIMQFYVPAQTSGDNDETEGVVQPINYCDIDNQPVPGEECTVPLEVLDYAKPLANVFIHGPAFEVQGAAFHHSFMDAYAAVSLDDGETFKRENLSDSATLTSWDISLHSPADKEVRPTTHNVLIGSKNNGAMHADGYDMPYTAHCTECHGKALQGTYQAPSCFSCHDHRWAEETPDFLGPVITTAIWKNGKLTGTGENAAAQSEVSIVNAEMGDEIMVTDATLKGDFSFNTQPESVSNDLLPPCTVLATAADIEGTALRVLDKTGEPVQECVGYADDLADGYPGGAYNVFHAVAGNKVLVAWPSRYCGEGEPAYSYAYKGPANELLLEEAKLLRRQAVADLFGESFDVTTDLYLTDLFGVGGSQGSIDFGDEGYPQAGIVPFGCVWTARGVLLPGDDPRTGDGTGGEGDIVEESHIVWTKAERLTSGRRDPNRIEVRGVAGAGFVITWQEDPDGIRPGQGLGPGEGWSGAVAHDKTDVWYSFIPWEYFDLVEDINVVDEEGTPTGTAYVNIADHPLPGSDQTNPDFGSGRPQVFVPMAVPMRLTNNDKCTALDYGPDVTLDVDDPKYFSYCNYDVAAAYGLQDFCDATVDIPLGNTDPVEYGPICVNADGLPNIANTAATRPRLSLQGYDSNSDDAVDSAWVIVAMEESKGLGRYAFLPDGTPCDEEATDASPDCTSDIGKNQWYFSFDMGDPATSATAGKEYGLVQNLVSQGNMLNQPEVDWRTGAFYPVINTEVMWDFGDYNYDLYNTEIARRASLLVQGIGKAEASTSGILAMPSWKQGIMRQGGPADTMFRRIVLPGGYAGGIDNNPYAFTNMECAEWAVFDTPNPYYPDGLCVAPATNLSSVVPDTCSDDGDGDGLCPTVVDGGTYGIGDTNPILQGYTQQAGDTTRVLTWHQCPSAGAVQTDTNGSTAVGITPVTCDETDLVGNLRDQSWYNPFDVSKGHRGFIDGDFVMFLYAWSPNWRLNAKGNDRYELYVRRSFDGGETFTVTPTTFTASDGNTYPGAGTVTCESYRTESGVPSTDEPKACYSFAAGDAEHARNVTQHKSMRITTLDPRYAPTLASISDTCIEDLALPDGVDAANWGCNDLSTVSDDSTAGTDNDVRNPSRYFMAFETGDNTTVEVGEAEPLNLYYARAEGFGDYYVVWSEIDTGYSTVDDCFPTDPHGVEVSDVIAGSGFCNEFDNMNTGQSFEASEASLTANPDGSKMYGVWTQMFENTADLHEGEAMARRIWWIDEYISEDPTKSYTLPGIFGPDPDGDG